MYVAAILINYCHPWLVLMGGDLYLRKIYRACLSSAAALVGDDVQFVF